jgi:hypothetical protein
MRTLWAHQRSCALVLGSLVLALGACAGGPAPGEPDVFPVDTTWYISARARDDKGKATPELADMLEFGLVLSEPYSGDPLEGRIPFRIRATERLSRAEFVATLRRRMSSARGSGGGAPDPSAFAVFYTHGYGTSLEESWQHTSTSRTRARGRAPWIVFAWPSIGSGVAWPAEGDLLVRAYVQDSVSAIASRHAYARALEAVLEGTGSGGLVVVAHSLGTQAAGRAMAFDPALSAALARDPLRAVAFFSPDVDAEYFADSLAPALGPVARRLVLYAASDDRALALSVRIAKAPRAGRFEHEEGPPAPPPGVESVDMTEGVSADGWWRRTFGPRHALRRRSAALFDLIHIVAPGFSAECRATLGTGSLLPNGVWRLSSSPLPGVAAVARCESSARPLG